MHVARARRHRARTIVIAPNGPLPRAGPFRSMTRLADLLCAAGHRVVRADLRGFGEAEADVPEATIHEHYRRIERGLHVDDLLAVSPLSRTTGDPLVLFGSCGGAVTSVRAAEGDPRVRAGVGYALPAVLTAGAAPSSRAARGPRARSRWRAWGSARRSCAARAGDSCPARLAPWLNVPLIRALRALAGDRPLLLLFGGEDDVQDQLARYGLDRLRGVDVDELPGIGPPLRRSGGCRARRRRDGRLAGTLSCRRRRRVLPG